MKPETMDWQSWMDLLSWDEMNAIAYETGFRRQDRGKLPCFDESKAEIFNEAIDKARLAKLP